MSSYPDILHALHALPLPQLLLLRRRHRGQSAPSAPPPPLSPPLTAKIAALQLHPALEACLHLRNADLAAAHFLVRHMQAPPALEGMLLHSMLHRLEGDFDNARAWVRSIVEGCREGEEDVFTAVWAPIGSGKEGLASVEGEGRLEIAKERCLAFVDRCERVRKGEGDGYEQEVEAEWRREWSDVLRWCEGKFGTERWADASSEWVRPGEEVRNIGQDMVSGGKGWRKF